MRLALLLAALLAAPAAAPVAAQDVPAQFEAARAAFVPPGLEDGPDEGAAMAALLPALVGDWADAGVLAQGHALDPALLARACERIPVTLTLDGARGFTLSRGAAGAALPVRHQPLIGNTFQRSASEPDLRARLALPEDMATPPGALLNPSIRGVVHLFHPSPHILVLAAEGGRPEILARCP